MSTSPQHHHPQHLHPHPLEHPPLKQDQVGGDPTTCDNNNSSSKQNPSLIITEALECVCQSMVGLVSADSAVASPQSQRKPSVGSITMVGGKTNCKIIILASTAGEYHVRFMSIFRINPLSKVIVFPFDTCAHTIKGLKVICVGRFKSIVDVGLVCMLIHINLIHPSRLSNMTGISILCSIARELRTHRISYFHFHHILFYVSIKGKTQGKKFKH